MGLLSKLGLEWKLHGDGSAPPPGQAVLPDERLSWPRTIGLGAQHVVAMFGATFVFPLVMGLDANLAIMLSGLATILFLLVVRGRVPSYLGTSAAFVGAVTAIRAAGGDSATVTGAILVAGAVLALVGIGVQVAGTDTLHRVFPPVVSGAVVLLIGFNLAPVVAQIYWPQDQWVALATTVVVLAAGVLLRGFLGRIAVFIGLVFGFVLSWALDRVAGPLHGPDATGKVTEHFRVDLGAVADAPWFGLPHLHAPHFATSAVLVALPGVIALVAENTGHVKAVAAMTRTDLDDSLGRAVFADGLATALASSVGGSPTTTYAENIGVMAATRVYSTAAYWVAAFTALLFGLCPKFGALIAATPGGVLGGITVVLYGMVGLLGAQIWISNGVDFARPANLLPVAAGVIAGIGGVSVVVTESFSVSGIALGTLITLLGYHGLRAAARLGAPARPSEEQEEDREEDREGDEHKQGGPAEPVLTHHA